MADLMIRASEWVARHDTAWRNVALFFAGATIGLVLGVSTNSAIQDPGDALSLVFDASARPIAVLNWVAVVVLVLALALPPVARWMVSRASKDEELVDLLHSARIPYLENAGVLSIDGAATVVRSPTIHEGWRLQQGDIDFRHDDTEWRPQVPAEARNRFHEELRDDGRTENGTMIMLTNSPTGGTDVPVLRLQARNVQFFDLRLYWERLFDPSTTAEMVNDVIERHVVSFPHPLTLQAVVVTSDRHVLLTQRSRKVYWYPGAWSCSLEEGMTTSDIAEGNVGVGSIERLVVRAMREELGLEDRVDFFADNARILSVFVEATPSVISLQLCAVIRLDMTSKELLSRLRDASGREDDELRDWRIAPSNDLLPYLTAANSADIAFHPTARYRMLMYLLHERGHKHLRSDLQKSSLRTDKDPLGLYSDQYEPVGPLSKLPSGDA